MISVDVIVPCYRYGHFLAHCVGSVLSQDGVDVRVLIIDDCSPDNTKEVGEALSRKYPNVTFRRHERNAGHIATYNEGIAWTSSPYYLLLSADDYLLPGALERTTAFLNTHPKVGLAFGQQVVSSPSGELLRAAVTSQENEWIVIPGTAFIQASGAKNQVPTPAAVVRTELQKLIGGYRPDLPHSGDMEMWMRLAARADVGVSQAVHAVYRRHEGNMSLAYTADHWLPDVIQRRAAIDQLLVFEALERKVAKRLHRHAIKSLALEAVGLASSAFNSNQMQASSKLRRFALELDPTIRMSRPWWKLEVKRSLGLGGWQSCQQSFRQLRRRSSASSILDASAKRGTD